MHDRRVDRDDDVDMRKDRRIGGSMTSATNINTSSQEICNRKPDAGRSEEVLYVVLAKPTIRVVKSYVALDLANSRWAFRDDAIFAQAIEAKVKEILRALKSPTTLGHPLEPIPWRRSAYSSSVQGEADLRLVFCPPRTIDAVDIIAFGKRRLPDTSHSRPAPALRHL